MNDTTSLTTFALVVVFTVIVSTGAVSATVQSQQTAPNTTNTTPNTIDTISNDRRNLSRKAGVAVTEHKPGTETRIVTARKSIEPNDEWENATGIGKGQTVLASINDKDQDWYVTQIADDGNTVKVSVTAGDSVNISIFLYRSGNLLDRSYVYSGESLTLFGPFNGEGPYYVLIRGESDSATGQYAFTLYIGGGGATNANAKKSGGSGFPWTLVWIGIALFVVIVAILLFAYTGEEDK